MSQYEGAAIGMLWAVMRKCGIKETSITVEQLRCMPREGLIEISYDHTTRTYKAKDVSDENPDPWNSRLYDTGKG